MKARGFLDIACRNIFCPDHLAPSPLT
jgi:hypothetical protein